MKNIKQCSILLFFLLVSLLTNAQIGIGTMTPNPSAILDLTSVDKGFLVPRMSSAARNLIVPAASGLMIYNTEVGQIQVNISTDPQVPKWTVVVSSIVNTGTGAGSVIGGGTGNNASGTGSTIAGGTGNVASGANSAIGGGTSNVSSGANSSISGGTTNETYGEAASITGGTSNKAMTAKSHIGGGSGNQILLAGESAVIVGGTNNLATGAASSIGGGTSNYVSGAAAAISGGTTNEATNVETFVGGGLTNKATNVHSAILGGTANVASGIASSVSGGTANVAKGANATVSGGNANLADGAQAAISGGGSNKTYGDFSTVSGGIGNTANSFGEWVGGLYGTETVGTSGSFAATDRLFNLGNGTGAGGLRNDALTVLKNGLATLPSVTNFLIAGNANGKAIVTKEFTDANYAKFSETAPVSSTAVGVLGEIRMTSEYIYACYATNKWIRILVPTSPAW